MSVVTLLAPFAASLKAIKRQQLRSVEQQLAANVARQKFLRDLIADTEKRAKVSSMEKAPKADPRFVGVTTADRLNAPRNLTAARLEWQTLAEERANLVKWFKTHE